MAYSGLALRSFMEFKRRNLALLLLSARESVMANFRPTLKAFGLTDQQWRILRALNSAGEMEAGQIADTCKILSPSLTGILSRMLAQGLICRAWSTVDQRRSIISLSPEGEALVARVQPKVEERYEHIEAVLGHERMQALYEMLDEILMLLPLDGEVDHDEEEAKPARKRSKASAK